MDRFVAPILSPDQFYVPPLGGKQNIILLSNLSDQWSFASHAGWISAPERSASAVWSFTVDANSSEVRQSTIAVSRNGVSAKQIEVRQASGALLAFETEVVLSPPPATEREPFPLIMELGIAGKYIAKEIQNLPPEVQPAALAAVSVLIGSLSLAAIAARAAFTKVPNPPNYLAHDPFPMTVKLIGKQAALLSVYIDEEVTQE